MMQQTKKKMVLEHLVVHKMNSSADLKQVNLCLSLHNISCMRPLPGGIASRLTGVEATQPILHNMSRQCDTRAL